MPATMTTVSAILKEIYEGQIQEQLNNDVVALRRIERSSEGITSEVGGRYVTFPIHTKRNSGIGARTELQALPVAGNQGTAAARVNLKYLYGIVRLSGQTLKLADSNFQAFSSALDLEINGLKADLAKDLNRQVYGTGNGVLSTANAVGTGALNNNPFNTANNNQIKYLEIGMQVDVYDAAQATLKASNRQILSINTTTFQVIFDGAAQSTVATDVLVRTGNGNLGGGTDTAGAREITGLSGIVGNATLFNINPGTEVKWQSILDSNSGTNRPLSEGLMILNTDRCRQNGGTPSVIFCGLGVRRAYFNLLSQQRRYQGTTEFAGGFSGLTFTTDRGDIPVVVDVDCQDNTMYGIDEKQLKVFREEDFSFMDYDGSKWQRVVGFDAYEATMFSYQELGTHRRNTHFKISDITEG